MDDASESAPAEHLDFSVTLSAEPAFAETAGALAARAGDFSGCTADDARRLGDAVRQVFARLAATATVAEHLELVIHGGPRIVRIDLCCSGPGAGPGLEARVSGLPDVEPIHALVDRVEFGDSGGSAFCRLTQQVRPAR
jgi:hypothetical protein